MREAGRRYRSTHAGRLNNAARQKRYRERQKNKVTHQGSHTVPRSAEVVPETPFVGHLGAIQVCCCCARPVSPFVRLDFLRPYARRHTQTNPWSMNR